MDTCSQAYVQVSSSHLSEKEVSGRLQKSRPTYVPQKLGRKRKDVLAFIGRLLGGHLVNTTIYALAENVLQRIKTCLVIGWNRRNMSKSNYVLTSQSGNEPEDRNGETARMLSNSKQSPSQGRLCEASKELRECCLGLDCNVNDKSSNVPKRVNGRGKKRCKAVTRRIITRSIARPRFMRLKLTKDQKRQHPCRKSQLSKKFTFLRKRCARLKKENDKVPISNEIAEPNHLTLRDVNTIQQQSCDMIQPVEVPYQRECDLPESNSLQTRECLETLPCKEHQSDVVKKKRVRNKKRTRQKTETLLNILAADQKIDGGALCKEIEQRSSRKKSKRLRTKLKSSNVIQSQPHLGLSSLSLKINYPDINDWPSLTELERPKGLIKEAAREIVKNKQVSSVARNARKLLVDIAASQTGDLDSCRQMTTSYCVIDQQHDTLNIAGNQRTWASVAAQSLASSAKVTFGYTSTAITCQPNASENTPKCKPPATEPVNKFCKRKWGSKLECSNKQWADYYKGKEKPNSRKYSAENEERTKRRKTIRNRRNNMKQWCGQKEQVLVLAASRKHKKIQKTEKSDGTIAITKALHRLKRPKNWLHQNCQMDKMPVVYNQSMGPVISQAEESGSEETSKVMTRSVMAYLNKRNSSAPAVGKTYGNLDKDFVQCPGLGSLSVKSGETIDLNDSRKNCFRGLSFHNHLEKKDQRTSLKDEDINKQKKVSVRYRALLRGASGRLDMKPVTENQTRSKKADNVWQEKLRKKQRYLRHERQAIQVSSHQLSADLTTGISGDKPQVNSDQCRAATSTEMLIENTQESSNQISVGSSTELPGQSNNSVYGTCPAVHVICPYWLRSMPSNSAHMQWETPSKIPENKKTGEETKNLGTITIVSTPTTNTTPCRRSERLSNRDAMKNTCTVYNSLTETATPESVF